MQFFTVLSAALALLTASQLVGAQTQCTTFPCPGIIGQCNTCINFKGQTVAITRRVCGEYSLQKCRAIFKGPSGLCNDGCNNCFCSANGVISTKLACPPYSMNDCLAVHGDGQWECVNSMCTCTPCGIGYSI